MNPDPVHNSCDAKEEDHRRYDRMAKKVGVKFVMSVLNIGTLVWAKMPGYCRFVLLKLEAINLTLLLLNTTYPVLANSVDPDQLASDLDLHCLSLNM